MKRTHGAACVLVVAALGLAPVAASAGVSAEHAKHPAPPESGKWRVTGGLTGSMRVTHQHAAVSHLKARIAPTAETACGTGTVTVVGKHKIIHAKGDSEFGTYNLWAVGKNEPDADPVIQPEKVTVIQNGHHRKGTFYISFAGAKGHTKAADSGGAIDYHGGNCELQFEVHKS
ncbi:MAG TPA: hypothetical protein VHW92_00805 [Mycobacteriales bacterium]|jgi:hypothetical protein|nr:hypothetical protein [Mycobacteriales bacterium]